MLVDSLVCSVAVIKGIILSFGASFDSNGVSDG